MGFAVKELKGKALDAARERALTDSLIAHGVSAERLRGRTLLEDLSSQNLERIQTGTYHSRPEMAEAESVVRQIQAYFVHHTNATGRNLALPTLSSDTLKKITGIGGLNSKDIFNDDFVKSGGNVYFFLRFESAQRPERGDFRSSYGPHALVLDRNFARKNAWVSPFVMYPDEMASVSEMLDPSLIGSLNRINGKSRFPTGFFNIHRTAPSYIWENAIKYPNDPLSAVLLRYRNQLGKLDFTVDDFEKLVQNELLLALDRLRIQDPQKFRQDVVDLSPENFKKKGLAVLIQLVLKPLRMHATSETMSGFEGKVPVLVPAKAIHYYIQDKEPARK